MGRRVNRWGIVEKWQGKAPFLSRVAPAVAFQVEKWRNEVPEQWGTERRGLDAERLRLALHRADYLKVDPYLVAYVIMGAEWLFRTRPLTQQDIEDSLDQIEAKLRTMGIGGSMPWHSSLLVGGIYRDVVAGLRGAPHLVSLGRWAFPIKGWRDLVAGQERGRKLKTLTDVSKGTKPGRAGALSPIIAGLLVDSFAERAGQAGVGARALAIEVASILRGSEIEPSDFARWVHAALSPAPEANTGVLGTPPADLRNWLLLRWNSAYEMCFKNPRRYWSTFLIEAATNPVAVFLALADPDVVTQLYGIAWWRTRSPRRGQFP